MGRVFALSAGRQNLISEIVKNKLKCITII